PVNGGNDRPSGLLAMTSSGGPELAPASESLAPASERADPLSDVLLGVRLTTAVFFRVEAHSPWVIEVPDGAALAPRVMPRAQHISAYPVVAEGGCWGGLVGEAPVSLAAGDVLVLPRGDPYVMSSACDLRGGPAREEVVGFLQAMAAGRLPFT